MDKHLILEQFSFYRDAPTVLQKQVLQTAEYATLPPDTVYYRDGESCTRIAFVGEGRVRVFKRSPSGREITLYHVGPGESCILTASCVLTGLRYPATAVVESDHSLEGVVVPANHFRDWVAHYDAVRNFVFELMSHRLTTMMMLIEEVAFGKLDRRLAAFLNRRSAETGQASLSITHDQIAAELGSAREVISRVLKEFERRGLVRLSRGKLELLNLQKLRDVEHIE